MQRQKTDNTLFLEAQLFKNRLLNLYKILEKKAEDPKVNGNECAKCCEVAANIAIYVLKIESEATAEFMDSEEYQEFMIKHHFREKEED
jgi:hypothetical protein